MEKSIISVVMFFFLLMPISVVAISQRCVDNTTIERAYNYTFIMDGNPMDMNVTRQENCPYGCDNVTDTCAPNPAELTYGFTFLILGLLFVVGVIVKVWG